jgi:hypothetical protein
MSEKKVVTNTKDIVCQICKDKLIKNGVATLSGDKGLIPDKTGKLCEFDSWWVLNDMYNFENISFTKPTDGVRYLTCPNCTNIPLGFQKEGIDKFYLSFRHVDYK